MRPFARFAWGLLVYDVAVVAWGAYVRATGSGAGCGRHWPTCNGTILPRAPRIETLVELSHRVSSAGALALTLVLLVWACREFPRKHRVRQGAALATALMGTEALIGAGLVLFELVAHDASLSRALSMSLHLVNTFLLLACTALTAWWSSGGAPLTVRGHGACGVLLTIALAAMLFVGVSGAVTALGDTLFPSSSLAEGIARDFGVEAHLFVRLRVLHPVAATATAALIVVATRWVRNLHATRTVDVLSRLAGASVFAQVGAGLLDLVLRAPVWMQLVHIVLADAVWILLVLTTAASFSDAPAARTISRPSDPGNTQLPPTRYRRRPAA